MISLLNAFPNSFLPAQGKEVKMLGLSEAQASELLAKGFSSFVGHQNFAEVLSARTGVPIPVNRGFAPVPTQENPALVAAVIPPRRLGEGESWTEDEILKMPITWVLITSVE